MKSDLINKTVSLYSGLGWKSLFTKIRFWDAPFVEVEKLVPKSGVMIDLGCGEGIFTNYLALASNNRKITGVEIDKGRIKQADKRLKNVKFIQGDATKLKVPRADIIFMFHLLHHLSSFNDQVKMINECAKKLKKMEN